VQLTEARGQLAGAAAVRDGEQLSLISTGGTVIKMPVVEIKRLGRSTQGVIVMRLRKDEVVSSIARVAEGEGENGAENDAEAEDVDSAPAAEETEKK
jgi:DNA gyrase subunit A